MFLENICIPICCVDYAQQKPNWPEACRYVCDFWLRYSPPDGALWNVFHARQLFCKHGGNISKWCWEPEQLEIFLCQGVCLGTVLAPCTQTQLCRSDKTWAASAAVPTPPPPFLAFCSLSFLLSVRNLTIIKPAENIMQTGKPCLISGMRAGPWWHITPLYRYLCTIYWEKKSFLLNANDWHINNGSTPPGEHQDETSAVLAAFAWSSGLTLERRNLKAFQIPDPHNSHIKDLCTLKRTLHHNTTESV